MARKSAFHRRGVAFFENQCIVVAQLFAARNVVQRINENATVLFKRFTVWFAPVIYPAGIIAAAAAVDYFAAGQAEIKRMVEWTAFEFRAP